MGAPASIWNQIAPRMQNKELARIFALTDQAQMDEALSNWARARVGSEPMLLLAFEELAPLLVENMAISHWTERNPQWLGAMPEVLTPGEAALLAQGDYMLDEQQTRQLIEQLRSL